MMQSLLSPSAVEAGLVAIADARATDAQREAAEAFARIGLPHRRVEAFRWTDFRAALREAPAPALPAADSLLAPGPFDIDASIIKVVNGDVSELAHNCAGLEVRSALNDAPLAAALGDHPLALLSAAKATRLIEVRVNGAVERPLWIRRVADAGATASRVRIALAPGASMTLLESFEGRAGAFATDVTEVELEAGAALTRIVFQSAHESGAVASVASVSAAKDARFEQTSLAFGGKLARIETRVDSAGAQVDFKSASVLAQARHADVTSHVTHSAPEGRTTQLHKSVLRDRSRSVFQGKFLVARGAQKTDARMRANGLLLTEGAEVYHKPELEIYADDVSCAHGATAGAIDVDALFYLRQRGLSETAARALLVEAFLGEVFEGVANPGVAAAFRAHTARWLEGA